MHCVYHQTVHYTVYMKCISSNCTVHVKCTSPSRTLDSVWLGDDSCCHGDAVKFRHTCPHHSPFITTLTIVSITPAVTE